jgi:hypothetical protein
MSHEWFPEKYDGLGQPDWPEKVIPISFPPAGIDIWTFESEFCKNSVRHVQNALSQRDKVAVSARGDGFLAAAERTTAAPKVTDAPP